MYECLRDKEVKLCVFATASKDGKPASAVLGYAIKEDLTILLSTQKTTKKYANIVENPRVALNFGWSFSEINIQYEGECSILDSGEEHEQLEAFFFQQNPHAEKFKNPNLVILKIRPTWIRLNDLTVTPPNEEEKNFS